MTPSIRAGSIGPGISLHDGLSFYTRHGFLDQSSGAHPESAALCGERAALVNDRFATASGGGLKGRH
jgi:hypothetical protein